MYTGEQRGGAASNQPATNSSKNHVIEATTAYLQTVTEAVFWKPGMCFLNTRDKKC